MATGRSVQGALAPLPHWKRLSVGRMHESEMFRRRLECARSRCGSAEDALHDARRSRCWRSGRRRWPRSRRARTRFPRGRSRWWCRSRRAAATTSWRVSSASAWARRSDSRSWSRTGRAPAGNIGSRQAARSAPDGYTMLLAFTGTIGVDPSLYADLARRAAKEFLYPLKCIS